jgi:hypothetical protein
MKNQVATAFVFTIAIISVSFYALTSQTAASQHPEFFAGDTINGTSLEQLAQEYWQWQIGLPPSDQIPRDPKTNLHQCYLSYDSNNTVAFLLSSFDTKYSSKCTIPSEKYLLIPLLVGECDPTVPEERTKSGKIEDLWACAREADEPFDTWEVSLDGQVIFKKVGSEEVNAELKDDILVRNSSQFTIVIPKDNAYGVAAGSYPAVVDGYYLPMTPLPPGEHMLKYKIVYEEPSVGPLKKYVPGEVTYNLTVKP